MQISDDGHGSSSRSVRPTPVTAGAIWRSALGVLCERLADAGLSSERARDLGEAAIIAGALRHVPRTVDEACDMALGALIQR